jgi:hypothetical protein
MANALFGSAAALAASKTYASCTEAKQFTRRCIDEDGDLLLRVGSELAKEKPVEFKVCSAAMRRASPVWKTMLFGPWKEAKPLQGSWIVDLPEDKPWPMGIILAIIHGTFLEIPKSVSLSQLNDILIHTEKYDLIHIIGPWAGTWVEAVKNPKSSHPPISAYSHKGHCSFQAAELTGDDHVMRIYAAWEMGCEDIVSEEIANFVFNLWATVGTTNTHYYSNSQVQPLRFESHFGPPDLLGTALHSNLLTI